MFALQAVVGGLFIANGIITVLKQLERIWEDCSGLNAYALSLIVIVGGVFGLCTSIGQSIILLLIPDYETTGPQC